MYWIQTESGLAFDFENPRPEMIDMEDVATALSYMPRFNGHTRSHYSVAEHSLLVSRLVPEPDALWGLLHDAHEAYTGDIVSPLKRILPQIKAIEKKIQDAICQKLGISPTCPESVYTADLRLLGTERDKFFPQQPCSWDIPVPPYPDVIFREYDPETIRTEFLRRLYSLL